MRAGGAFVFDVSTPHKLKDILCSGLFGEDREEITYIWQNTWHEKRQTVELDLTFFVREEDGKYRRIDERQHQRAWDQQTLKETLWHAGFRAVSLYGDYTMNAATDENQRWHVAATRGEE